MAQRDEPSYYLFLVDCDFIKKLYYRESKLSSISYEVMNLLPDSMHTQSII